MRRTFFKRRTRIRRKIKLFSILIFLMTTGVVLLTYTDLTESNAKAKIDKETISQYLRRWEVFKVTQGHFANTTCGNEDALECHAGPCVDPACTTTFLPPRARLERLVSTQYPISIRHLQVLRSLGARVPPADIVFLTAASQNHFEESQGVIRDLHTKVFPWLNSNTKYSYRFIYYNLGLTTESVALAHSPHCKLLMWMDASVRFKSGDVSLIIERAMANGLFIQRNDYMMARHVMPEMLQYFHAEACLLAPFYETEANFFVVKNEPLMRKTVLDPWVACAFAPRCIYPGHNWRKLLKCPVGIQGYSLCHRFDQAALGVILVTLFDFKLSHLVVPDNNTDYYLLRNDKVEYFPDTV